MHELYIAILQHIGACRAVWVPGQDLAMLHLTRNCGKRTVCDCLSLYSTLYEHLCTHMLYAGYHVSSRLALGSGFARLGNARVCPALQAPLLQHKFHLGIPDQESFYLSVL